MLFVGAAVSAARVGTPNLLIRLRCTMVVVVTRSADGTFGSHIPPKTLNIHLLYNYACAQQVPNETPERQPTL